MCQIRLSQIKQIINQQMSHFFFDFETLKSGTQQMVESLKRCYSDMNNKRVSPLVEPGFLRNQFPQSPPEQGTQMKDVIQQAEQKIYPGLMLWQSPKYFGYFPSSIAVTNIMAEMFATTFHSPGFNYSASPSHTELQNIQMDWSAKALNLPDDFLLNNSGGGIINNSTTESVFVTVHAAKRKKMAELQINEIDPRMLKFVGYFSQISHNGAQKGLLMKEVYYRRPVRVFYSQQNKNFQIDEKHLQELIVKDVEDGLIPFWFGSTYGSTLSGAIDFTSQVVRICKKYKIWINIDAAYLGSAWICEEFRPDRQLLAQVDSICINFSKVLLLGTGGSVMFIKDKKQLNQAFGGTAKFSFYANKFSGRHDVVDYKDWIVGLGRRNNSIKFYFLFQHYGMENLRKLIRQTDAKATQLRDMIQKDEDIFQVFCKIFGIVCFRVKCKQGRVSQDLTKKVIERTKNIEQGFSSPGSFKGINLIRIVIGNYHSDMKTISNYYEKIKEVANQQRELSSQNIIS